MTKNARILRNNIILTLSTLSAVIGIFFLFWILFTLVINGISGLEWKVFTNDGAPPGFAEGGLRHAIVGQLMLTIGATVVGVPIGILAGTYLSEFGQGSKLASFIRDISDVMISAPSVVIGTFVYAVYVSHTGNFSGWAGIIALGIMMLPIVVRTTDDMLALVPQSLREAAIALGAPKWKVILQVVYRGAKVGILTGVLLSISRVAGEAAPLLFTSLNNNFFTMNLNEPMPSLTVTMFNYATSPYEDWQQLGWVAAFLLAAFVLTLNIIGRIIISKKKGS